MAGPPARTWATSTEVGAAAARPLPRRHCRESAAGSRAPGGGAGSGPARWARDTVGCLSLVTARPGPLARNFTGKLSRNLAWARAARTQGPGPGGPGPPGPGGGPGPGAATVALALSHGPLPGQPQAGRAGCRRDWQLRPGLLPA